MNGIYLAIEDIKRMWKSNILRKTVIGLIVLPLVYSFIYLWAFWNPTDYLYKLPIALVNNDKGIYQGSKNINLGKELSNTLVKDNKLSWNLISKEEGDKGINKLRYFLVLYIPSDFTQNAYSVGTDNPKQTKLVYKINEGANMLGAKVTRSIMEKIKEELRVKLSTKYLDVIFEEIKNGGEGLEKAASGAKQLANGSNIAYKGMQDLENGLLKSRDGMNSLSDGLGKLQTGANKLENGIIKLNTIVNVSSKGVKEVGEQLTVVLTQINDMIGNFKNISNSLNDFSQKIKQNSIALDNAIKDINNVKDILKKTRQDAIAPVLDRINKQNEELENVSANINKLIEKYPNLKDDPAINGILTSISNLKSYNEKIKNDYNNLNKYIDSMDNSLSSIANNISNSNKDLASKIDSISKDINDLSSSEIINMINASKDRLSTLPKDLNSLAQGTTQLEEGSTALVNGLNSFSSGFNLLKNGNTQLIDGAGKLKDGLNAISVGQNELATKLSQAAAMASKDSKSDERINIIANPIKLNEKNLNSVPNNGTGFAPYFIALSLWVGSLVLFFAIDLKKVSAMPKRRISYMSNKYIALCSVSVFQAIISVFILHTGLGLSTRLSPTVLYSFAIIIGLTYTAILFMMLYLLGDDVGRFMAVLILMLQLTSSGGSYPHQLEPKFFDFIHSLLPMTYAVEGLRSIISMGKEELVIRDGFILLTYGMISLVILYLLKKNSFLHEIEKTDIV